MRAIITHARPGSCPARLLRHTPPGPTSGTPSTRAPSRRARPTLATPPHHTEAPLLVRLTTGIPHSWCLTPQAYATAATPQGKAGASLARPTPGMPHHGHPPPRRPIRASLALLPHAACTPASSHGKPGHSARLPTLQAPNGNRQTTSAQEHRSTTRPVFPLRALPPLAPRLPPAMLALPAHSEVPAQGARPPAPVFGTEVPAQAARPPVTLVVPGARGRNGAPALGFPNGSPLAFARALDQRSCSHSALRSPRCLCLRLGPGAPALQPRGCATPLRRCLLQGPCFPLPSSALSPSLSRHRS